MVNNLLEANHLLEANGLRKIGREGPPTIASVSGAPPTLYVDNGTGQLIQAVAVPQVGTTLAFMCTSPGFVEEVNTLYKKKDKFNRGLELVRVGTVDNTWLTWVDAHEKCMSSGKVDAYLVEALGPGILLKPEYNKDSASMLPNVCVKRLTAATTATTGTITYVVVNIRPISPDEPLVCASHDVLYNLNLEEGKEKPWDQVRYIREHYHSTGYPTEGSVNFDYRQWNDVHLDNGWDQWLTSVTVDAKWPVDMVLIQCPLSHQLDCIDDKSKASFTVPWTQSMLATNRDPRHMDLQYIRSYWALLQIAYTLATDYDPSQRIAFVVMNKESIGKHPFAELLLESIRSLVILYQPNKDSIKDSVLIYSSLANHQVWVFQAGSDAAGEGRLVGPRMRRQYRLTTGQQKILLANGSDKEVPIETALHSTLADKVTNRLNTANGKKTLEVQDHKSIHYVPLSPTHLFTEFAFLGLLFSRKLDVTHFVSRLEEFRKPPGDVNYAMFRRRTLCEIARVRIYEHV